MAFIQQFSSQSVFKTPIYKLLYKRVSILTRDKAKAVIQSQSQQGFDTFTRADLQSKVTKAVQLFIIISTSYNKAFKGRAKVIIIVTITAFKVRNKLLYRLCKVSTQIFILISSSELSP